MKRGFYWRRQWKRRLLVLENGHLSYYDEAVSTLSLGGGEPNVSGGGAGAAAAGGFRQNTFEVLDGTFQGNPRQSKALLACSEVNCCPLTTEPLTTDLQLLSL